MEYNQLCYVNVWVIAAAFMQ